MREIKIQPSITNKDVYSLSRYFSEVGKVNLIKADEEVMLAQKIRYGDQAALEKLTKANLRFVISVAKQYQNNGLTLSDLISEGNLGLITAAKRFDTTKGFKFISYAVWWIRQSIQVAIAEQSRIIRLPLNQVACLNKIYKSTSKLEQQLQRKPTLRELAEDIETDVEKIAESMYCSKQHLSIDAPLMIGEDGSLLDVLQNSEANTDNLLLLESRTAEVRLLLNTLIEREKQVIKLFFGLDGYSAHTLEEIAELYHLNPISIRRIRDKALIKLKTYSKTSLLKTYL
jgi:RNA polymerase primary sigma factor